MGFFTGRKDRDATTTLFRPRVLLSHIIADIYIPAALLLATDQRQTIMGKSNDPQNKHLPDQKGG